MFDSRKELLNKIQLRRDTALEIKEVQFSGHRITEPHRDSFSDSIAAFKDQGRIDRPRFDMTAVVEAILNAVVHRDYSVYRSKVRLRLFENRLELYSPGLIANSMTIESLPFMQSARNEALCSLVTKCPAPDEPWLHTDRRTLMEKRGEGVPVILDNSEGLSGRTPAPA